MITTSSLNEVYKQLKKEAKPALILAHDEKFNRTLLENAKFTALVMNHQAQKKDKLRSLDIPLNNVLANIAKKRNIALAYDLAVLRLLHYPEQARELSRIMKTIEVCRKAGANLAILNAYTVEGAKALLRTLGASSQQASQALVL